MPLLTPHQRRTYTKASFHAPRSSDYRPGPYNRRALPSVDQLCKGVLPSLYVLHPCSLVILL